MLLIGHMRCGSTLLSHILQQHPQILGWGERHITYNTQADVDYLVRSSALVSERRWIRNEIIFDKVVNEMFTIEPNLLMAPNMRALFLLREPEPTLASILRTLGNTEGWTEDDAFDHYRTRMQQTRSLVKTIDDPLRATFFTYGQFVHQTEAVLNLLEAALNLTYPLEEEYETTERTGTWGWGDTSDRIHAGRIVRKERQIEYAFSSKMLDEATVLYEETLDILHRHALSLPTYQVIKETENTRDSARYISFNYSL
jgi:hypothetical protein